MCLLNSFSAEAPTVKYPEFIELFATTNLKALSRAIFAKSRAIRLGAQFSANAVPGGTSGRSEGLLRIPRPKDRGRVAGWI
jgi:hypothetical protein